MATSSLRTTKDITSVIVTDSDGTNEVELTAEQGNITIDLPETSGHATDRGGPGHLHPTEFVPITWSMTLNIQAWTGSSSPLEAFARTASGWDYGLCDTGSGDYSGLTLTAGTDTISNRGNVNLFQMRILITDPGDASTETLYLVNCTASSNFGEGFPSTLSVSGTSYMTTEAFLDNIATA